MKKIIAKLLFIYPLIQGTVGVIFNGNMLNTLFFLYIFLVFFMYALSSIVKRGSKIRKENFIIMFFLFGYIPIAFYQEFILGNGMGINGIAFYFYLLFFCILALFFLQDETLVNNYLKILRTPKCVLGLSMCYLTLIVVSFILHIGVDIGTWNTTTFRAWHGTPHAFSYELMILILMNFVTLKNCKDVLKTIAFFNIGIFSLLIFLSAARTGLVALFIIFVYYAKKLDTKKKIVIIFIGIALLLLVYKIGLFDSLIDKTIYSIEQGDIGGSRFDIWRSSLSSFSKKNFFEKIFGFGYSALLSFNENNGMQRVHGHNDFIITLVSYGIPNLLLYLYSLVKLLKCKWKSAGATLFIVFISAINGFYIYAPVLIVNILTIMIAFYEIEKNSF